MTIKSIKVYKKNLALTRPYTIATKTISDVESVFLEIELSNGIIGLGAANPAKEVVGEDADMSFQNLQSDGIQRFVGRDIAEIYSILPSVSAAFPHAPGTLAAMDIALHDAFCQYLGVSIAQFYGQKIEKMPTSVTIGIKGVTETVEEAKEYWDAGFRVLKVKLGHDMEEDIERLVKLRERFGQAIRIRVDANQGYETSQVAYFFNRIADLAIELVEQPTLVGQEKPLLTLPYKIRKQIAADESLKDLPMALFLAGTKRVGIFNIKLMKCGGIKEALNIATIAQAANIDLFWGCNDESIVSITAALHAAFSCAHTKYIDLDGSFDLAEDVVQSGFVLENGVMSLPKGAGLGLVR
ncbi:MAG: dipeptide epimerase [Saprospiraceae bacterium]|nr:dipeptide epimerase [Saprospiraceae bacterium]